MLLRALSRPHRSPSYDEIKEFPMFSWHDAGGLRHAIDLAVYPFPPRPDEQVTTLCGVEKTVTREDFPQLAEYKRYKKTCFDCDTVWRKRANIAPRPVLAGA